VEDVSESTDRMPGDEAEDEEEDEAGDDQAFFSRLEANETYQRVFNFCFIFLYALFF